MIKHAFSSINSVVNPAARNGLAGKGIIYYTPLAYYTYKADYIVYNNIYTPNNPSLFHTSLNGIITKAKSS